jgi:hypothetical protein
MVIKTSKDRLQILLVQLHDALCDPGPLGAFCPHPGRLVGAVTSAQRPVTPLYLSGIWCWTNLSLYRLSGALSNLLSPLLVQMCYTY